MHNSLVSVNIANYNNASYLAQCIESVLEQTYKNIELVIVDDCSTDESTSIIDSFKDSRIRLFQNDVNRGISKVRNQALTLSTGEYVTSLDSDDVYFSPDKIAAEMDTIQRYTLGRDSRIIAFSDVMYIDRYGKDILQVSSRDRVEEGHIFQGVLGRDVFIPRDYLCSKEQLLTAGGYNESISLYEDWDLKLRLAQQCEFYFSGTIGIGYRRHGKGLSAAATEDHDYWKNTILAQYS